MILDQQNVLSNSQAITATARSTHYYDRGAHGTPVRASAALKYGLSKGQKIPLLIQVTEAFNNLTSLKVAIRIDDNTGFSSPKILWESEEILLADLVAGYQFPIEVVPDGVDARYLEAYYTLTGAAPTTGKMFAGFTPGNDEPHS